MKISNKYLTASFKTRGAELTSLLKDGQEYIWQADPAHWNRHAPVLFPIVGKLKNNTYLHGGTPGMRSLKCGRIAKRLFLLY